MVTLNYEKERKTLELLRLGRQLLKQRVANYLAFLTKEIANYSERILKLTEKKIELVESLKNVGESVCMYMYR